MTTYYIDDATGDDSNSGTSWADAWKTLDKIYDTIINSAGHTFVLGDGIYYFMQYTDIQNTKSFSLAGQGAVIIRNPVNAVLHPYGYAPVYFRFHNINFSQAEGLFQQSPNGLYFLNCAFDDPVIHGIVDSTFNFNCFNSTTDGLHIPAPGDTITDATSNNIATVDAGITLTIGGSRGNNAEDGTRVSPGLIYNNTASKLSPFVGASAIYPRQYQSSVTTGFEDFPVALIIQDDSGARSFKPATLGWIQDPSTSGSLDIIDDVGIKLTSGDGVAALSPVFYYPIGIELNGVGVEVLEFASDTEAQVIDSTPLTTTRTIEYRISNTSFNQTDASPSWQTYDRNTVGLGISGYYLQYRIVFNLHAAL